MGDTHGSVSLVAGTVTYTPEADFNGLATASTTRSGQRHHQRRADFKTGTVYVNVTVTEVNDAPTAERRLEDRRRGRHALLPGSDLTANDCAGPANESGQTLTVTAVSRAPRRTAPSRSSPARSPTRRTPTSTARPASTTPSRDNGTTNGVADPLERRAAPSTSPSPRSTTPRRRRTTARRSPRTAPSERSSTCSPTTAPARRTRARQTPHDHRSRHAAPTAPPSVESGKIRYIPTEADYNGADSFTYTVTDNGTTNGDADSSRTPPRLRHRHRGQRRTRRRQRQRHRRRGRKRARRTCCANDSTGPANESGQTLTITAVGSPAHGTAVVQSGKVKYTPDADYNGCRLLHLHGHDNGTTNGVNGLQVGHRHGLRDRHRGQRRPDGESTTRVGRRGRLCDLPGPAT